MRSVFSERIPTDCDVIIATVPAALEAAERFLRLVPRDAGFLWRSPRGRVMAGGGYAFRVDTNGADRLEVMRAASRQFFSRLHVRTFDGKPFTPVLFGGISFAPGVPLAVPWEEFGSGSITLPRFGYVREGGVAHVMVSVRREELTGRNIEELARQLREILTGLETEAATSFIERHEMAEGSIHNLPAEDWGIYIDAIQTALASGQYAKLVAARRCVVDLARPVDEMSFMARLYAAYPDCTHFAVRREHALFLGATPETLFSKTGRGVITHALAGTIRVKDDPMLDTSGEAAMLQRSEKDRAEHALVVQKICEELAPMATSLRFAETPNARRVRNLVHLQTPINAEVRPEITAFDLLAALHPTPAVGGFPSKEAAEWLRLNEPLERGWYTGAVGWVDASGDGEFAVAIRCGVLTDEKAFLYAGAGIVKQSDAGSEYRETGAKLYPLLRALGIEST